MIRAAFIGSLLFIAGCATSERVQEMEDRLAELEATVEKLRARYQKPTYRFHFFQGIHTMAERGESSVV